jgi:hypothetical protein
MLHDLLPIAERAWNMPLTQYNILWFRFNANVAILQLFLQRGYDAAILRTAVPLTELASCPSSWPSALPPLSAPFFFEK